MKKVNLTGLALLLLTASFAQDTTKQSAFNVSGYAEVYYSYNFNKPANHTQPGFIYSHNRANEVSLNLGYVKAAYNTGKMRANIALAAGTYMNANLAAEPGVLKNIYEANAGVKIARRKNLWIDAGIFASHIGFETAVSKDCWTLTRSIMADNSPYYESGAKLSYTTDNGKWFLSLLILNGWQRIQRPDGNNTPAAGTQVTFKPNDRITLNSSTFIGNDKPDSTRQMRYFHDLYAIFQITPRFGITAAFDAGMEQQAKQSKRMYAWYTPAVILKLNTSDKTALAARAEYYSDSKGVIIAAGTPNGFKTWGFSANFDYNFLSSAVWRIEARTFNSKDAVFAKKDSENTRNIAFINTSIAVSF